MTWGRKPKNRGFHLTVTNLDYTAVTSLLATFQAFAQKQEIDVETCLTGPGPKQFTAVGSAVARGKGVDDAKLVKAMNDAAEAAGLNRNSTVDSRETGYLKLSISG